MASGPGASRSSDSASIAPVSSIRLLVVVSAARPPSSVTSPAGGTMTAPHPPGPGFPFAAPSVKTTIDCTLLEGLFSAVEGDGLSNERLERRRVDVFAFRDVDRAAHFSLETRREQTGRIL